MYKKVKLSFPYPEWDLKRQTPNSSCIWGDCQFFINEEIEECDYWFVFNYLLNPTEKVKCPKENVILITGEPFVIQKYHQSFLDQFYNIITCQREIRHPRITYSVQGHPWFVGARYKDGHYSNFTKGYDELTNLQSVKKTKLISIVTSDKQFTDGHKRRYEFALALKDYFRDDIDLYGRGIRDFEDKWEVLADYKYSIAIENCVYPDWITEKLFDCYLAHTFPFYYGAPNVTDYFKKESFKLIDIEDIDASKKSIEKILNNASHYEDSLGDILEGKEKCLNSTNIFPLMNRFMASDKVKKSRPDLKMISNSPMMHLPFHQRLLKKVFYAYQNLQRS